MTERGQSCYISNRPLLSVKQHKNTDTSCIYEALSSLWQMGCFYSSGAAIIGLQRAASVGVLLRKKNTKLCRKIHRFRLYWLDSAPVWISMLISCTNVNSGAAQIKFSWIFRQTLNSLKRLNCLWVPSPPPRSAQWFFSKDPLSPSFRFPPQLQDATEWALSYTVKMSNAYQAVYICTHTHKHTLW